MSKTMKQGILYALAALTAATFCQAKENETAAMKIAIIKADDVRGPTEQWGRFIDISAQRNVKVSCGVICESLANATKEYKDWLIAHENSGFVEFWNHGWDHKKWEENGVTIKEFRGSGYAHQKKHFTDAQDILQNVLGHPPLAFGTPYNASDEDTARVLQENNSIQLFFGYQDTPFGGATSAKMALRGEPDGTGKPNAAKFAEQYNKMKDTLTFAAIQFHPNSGNFKNGSGLDEYAKTLDILLNDGWTFMLPREYLAWLDQQ